MATVAVLLCLMGITTAIYAAASLSQYEILEDVWQMSSLVLFAVLLVAGGVLTAAMSYDMTGGQANLESRTIAILWGVSTGLLSSTVFILIQVTSDQWKPWRDGLGRSMVSTGTYIGRLISVLSFAGTLITFLSFFLDHLTRHEH